MYSWNTILYESDIPVDLLLERRRAKLVRSKSGCAIRSAGGLDGGPSVVFWCGEGLRMYWRRPMEGGAGARFFGVARMYWRRPMEGGAGARPSRSPSTSHPCQHLRLGNETLPINPQIPAQSSAAARVVPSVFQPARCWAAGDNLQLDLDMASQPALVSRNRRGAEAATGAWATPATRTDRIEFIWTVFRLSGGIACKFSETGWKRILSWTKAYFTDTDHTFSNIISRDDTSTMANLKERLWSGLPKQLKPSSHRQSELWASRVVHALSLWQRGESNNERRGRSSAWWGRRAHGFPAGAQDSGGLIQKLAPCSPFIIIIIEIHTFKFLKNQDKKI
jgi:hypothetical protein